MGATIHFKIKYHGLKFSSDSLDYFYNISTTRLNVTLGNECKTNLPPYTEFTSKDFSSLQQNIDDKKLVFLSDLKVLYYRDLGANQKSWVANQVKVKISNKSFEDADNHSYSGLSSETINAGYGRWVTLAPTGYNDISLQNNTDVYVLLVIDSDPQSDSWYYPSILYCSDDYYSANTKIFSDGKPDICARWCHADFEGIFYPTKNRLNIQTGMTDNSAKDVYINNFDTKQGKYISSTKYTTPFVLPSDYTDYPNIKHFVSFKNLYEGKPSTPPTPVTEHPNAGKAFLRIMYEKNTLNKPLLAEGFYNNNVWSDTNYNFISGPIYEVDNLKGFQDKSDLTIYQPSNTFDNLDKYNLPRITSYYHVDNDKGVLNEQSFYGGGNLKGYNYSNPTNGVPHTNGATVPLSNQYLDLNYMSTYNTVVVGNDHALSTSPTKDELIFYPYLTFNLPNEALTNYSIKILNTDSSSHPIDSFNNHGLIGGRKYTIEITNNNKKDYTTNTIYFVNNTDGKYLKLTDDYTFTAENNHQYIISSRKPVFDDYNVYALPVNTDIKTKVIIDFLHDKETDVSIMTTDGGLKRATLATNPINYDATGVKGTQVHLTTSPKPDSTKCITTDDTIYTIYYFANGKPEDLDLNNYSIDYLNKNATTKYVTNPKSNGADAVQTTEEFTPDFNEKFREVFSTPCSFTNYGYYLILPVELKDYYGVLVGTDGSTVLQKIYVNKENKIEEKYRPKSNDVVIGFYNEPYNEIGIDLDGYAGYYFYHNKDYGITSEGYIDPNRYDNFICLPFNLIVNYNAGELPAFQLRYKILNNPKKDLGGYYNPTTHKIDPITIKENTGGSSQTGGSTTGGSTGSSGSSQTGGSSGSSSGSSTGSSGSTSGSTGGSTSGSTGTTNPNTPTNLNNQIHLYSINQQNIIDLSTKDLSYQTSLNGFASYDANNFINQVYILPFSLPTNLKENVSNIVTGLFKLDTDTVAIKQDHYDLDLGSITIKPKYNNGFDYNVTKCELHLPFTNLINLDINDILNKTINIKYNVSLLNADTTVNILSDNDLIFTGKINIGTDLQLFSINSNNITGLLNSVLQNDVLIPYITITRNKPINNLVSYETNEHNQLSNYTGFIQTNNSSVSCGTQEEQQEIESLLNGGIYIK